MQNSLEVRVPLLDYAVVEFAARLPTCFKHRFNMPKYFLRRYLESRLIPDAEMLALVTREKHGFWFPLGKYMTGSLNDCHQADPCFYVKYV